jgi:hypothetical protein
MYKPLAAAVIAAVAASLVLALTLVPVASGFILRPRPEGKEEDVWIIRAIKRRYAPLLDGCMAHAGLVRILTLAITIRRSRWLRSRQRTSCPSWTKAPSSCRRSSPRKPRSMKWTGRIIASRISSATSPEWKTSCVERDAPSGPKIPGRTRSPTCSWF